MSEEISTLNKEKEEMIEEIKRIDLLQKRIDYLLRKTQEQNENNINKIIKKFKIQNDIPLAHQLELPKRFNNQKEMYQLLKLNITNQKLLIEKQEHSVGVNKSLISPRSRIKLMHLIRMKIPLDYNKNDENDMQLFTYQNKAIVSKRFINYIEITLTNKHSIKSIGIFSRSNDKQYKMKNIIGHERNSLGFIISSCQCYRSYEPIDVKFEKSSDYIISTIGCGFNQQTNDMFITINGKYFHSFDIANWDNLYFGISTKSHDGFSINTGESPFQFDIGNYSSSIDLTDTLILEQHTFIIPVEIKVNMNYSLIVYSSIYSTMKNLFTRLSTYFISNLLSDHDIQHIGIHNVDLNFSEIRPLYQNVKMLTKDYFDYSINVNDYDTVFDFISMKNRVIEVRMLRDNDVFD